MIINFLNTIIFIFLSFSMFFGFEDEYHLRLYITADIKAETEPCG